MEALEKKAPGFQNGTKKQDSTQLNRGENVSKSADPVVRE
jgi:hypothetical protein